MIFLLFFQVFHLRLRMALASLFHVIFHCIWTSNQCNNILHLHLLCLLSLLQIYSFILPFMFFSITLNFHLIFRLTLCLCKNTITIIVTITNMLICENFIKECNSNFNYGIFHSLWISCSIKNILISPVIVLTFVVALLCCRCCVLKIWWYLLTFCQPAKKYNNISNILEYKISIIVEYN